MQTTTASSLQPIASTNLPINKIASKHRNEQSLDYVVRSGFAGGVAGCLVRFFMSYYAANQIDIPSLHREKL